MIVLIVLVSANVVMWTLTMLLLIHIKQDDG